ncbi:hypothetical protein HZF02_32730 (plasmid) [Pseudomonas yamanorum]|nr:hypothetical protein HZF02_32730 [Pseudomonas yamanorum]
MSRADSLAANDKKVQDLVLRGTPPQFDSSLALSTTAHTQRALGNYSGGADQATANVVLTAADVGKFVSLSLGAAQVVALPLFADVPVGTTVVLHNPTGFDKTITAGENTGKISPDGNVYASVVLKQGDTALFTKQGVWRMHGAAALRYLNWITQPKFTSNKTPATTEFVQKSLGSFATSRGIGAATQLTPADVGVSFGMGGLEGYSVTLPEIADVPDGASIGFHCRNSSPVTILSKTGAQISPNGEYLSSITMKAGANAVFVKEGSVWCVYGTAGLKHSAMFSAVLGTSGYQRTPSGKLEQWVSVAMPTTQGGVTNFNWPIAFDVDCSAVAFAPNFTVSAFGYLNLAVVNRTKTGAQLLNNGMSATLGAVAVTTIFAVGY